VMEASRGLRRKEVECYAATRSYAHACACTHARFQDLLAHCACVATQRACVIERAPRLQGAVHPAAVPNGALRSPTLAEGHRRWRQPQPAGRALPLARSTILLALSVDVSVCSRALSLLLRRRTLPSSPPSIERLPCKGGRHWGCASKQRIAPLVRCYVRTDVIRC
jgi:hypothetical protein